MSIQILPGTYVDVVAGERESDLSVTGVVAMPLSLDWGDKVTTIYQGDSTDVSLGYDISDEKLKCVNEVMNGAEKLILYRTNNSGEKASGTLADGITATAKYAGIRGNDISVVVTANGDKFTITTLLDTTEMDSQTVSSVEDFEDNDFISLSGSGTLEAVTVKLAGGTNVEDDDAITAFENEMEKYEFNVLCYTGTDVDTTKDLISWVNSQRDKDNLIQMVESTVAADNPAVYYSTSGGKTTSYSLTAAEACATMAGLIAKQGVTGSLTHYNSITGWIDTEHLTREEQEERVLNGELVVTMIYGAPTVLYDINSLVTYTDANPKDFRKGLVMRTLDQFASDLKKLLDTECIGKIRNSVDGRAQIKAKIVKLATENYLENGYIEDFTADDVTITKTDTDEIMASVNIKVVDTVDKIQVTVTSLA